MECKVNSNQILLTETVYENFAEVRLDTDILIPDYCSPAIKILKCEVTPLIIGKSADGDRITVEGLCNIRLIYISEDSATVKSISEESRFSQSFTMREAPNKPQIKIKVRATNIICRLLNPRKANIKSAIGIAIKVRDTKPKEIIGGVEGNGVETLFESCDACTLIETGESDFKISGETDIGAIGGEISDIIKCSGTINVKETKIINNKVILKGTADVLCLFTTGENREDISSITAAIPFSHIIDVEGAEENDSCDIICEIHNLRCDIESNENNENRVIDIDISANAVAEVFRNQNLPILIDVYSTQYNTQTDTGEVVIERNTDNLLFNSILRNELALDIEDARIVCIDAVAVIQKMTAQGQGVSIEGDIQYTLFLYNNDEYRIMEKTMPFTIIKELNDVCKQMRCEARANVVNIGYTMLEDSKIDIKTELEIKIMAFETKTRQMITSVEIDEQNPVDIRKLAQVILYYGEKGERLWDIARKYLTSVDVIKKNNDIDENVLTEKQMLLISHR